MDPTPCIRRGSRRVRHPCRQWLRRRASRRCSPPPRISNSCTDASLKAGNCDVIMGVPVGLDMVGTTRPYYRSSYVFVSRSDRRLDIASMTDPRLKTLKIGVQLIGADGSNTPPGHALAEQGIVNNVVGYTVYGDYRQPDPPAQILEAVARGDIDIAAVWGPLAGYFARRVASEAHGRADHRHRAICSSAVPVRHRDRGAQGR